MPKNILNTLGRRFEGQGDEDPLHFLPFLHDEAGVDVPNGLEQHVSILAWMLEALEGGVELLVEIPVARRELAAKHVEEGKSDLVGAVCIGGMHVRLDVRGIVQQQIEHIVALMRKERTMKRRTKLAGVLFTAVLTMSVALALADKDADQDTVTGRLSGFQETPLTISSPGSGEFFATIRADETAIDYVLTYRDLSSAVLQAHIHFGRPAISGGIVLFLCTNLAPPAGVPTPQACPDFPATITGTLTAANVIPVPAQGIDPGATGFAEMIEAIRAGAAYANVHTTVNPGGEIRSRLRVDEDDKR
jgi:hypothetical protein